MNYKCPPWKHRKKHLPLLQKGLHPKKNQAPNQVLNHQATRTQAVIARIVSGKREKKPKAPKKHWLLQKLLKSIPLKMPKIQRGNEKEPIEEKFMRIVIKQHR